MTVSVPNGQVGVEFLRFGSSIPGSYWGCCACSIIQNFKVDPDAKASMQVCSGDGSHPLTNEKGEQLFVGTTYGELFDSRMRFGEFSKTNMPNHAFLAILTENQVNGAIGKKWLKKLKEHGFEFIRTVCNSVYAGESLSDTPSGEGSNRNYLFGLFRNVGSGTIRDQFTPPKAWTDLPSVVPEAWEAISHLNDATFAAVTETTVSDSKSLTDVVRTAQRKVWDNTPDAKFYTQAEIEAAGAPVFLFGRRTPSSQPQTLEQRKAFDEAAGKTAQPSLRAMNTAAPAPWA